MRGARDLCTSDLILAQATTYSTRASLLQLAGELAAAGHLEPTLAFENVCLTYPTRCARALEGVTFRVPAGRHVGICGRTGAGKSSLLNAVFGLVPLECGRMYIGNLELSSLTSRRAPSMVYALAQMP